MARFLFKTAIAVGAFLALHVLAAYRIGPGIDASYWKFTVPVQQSLVIGTSRAAQGIRPDLLAAEGFDGFYNFSFNLAMSPYGRTYHEKVTSMLAEGGEGRWFLVEVSPWALASTSHDPDDETRFRENKRALARVNTLHQRPNFQYLFRQLQVPWGQAMLARGGRMLELHEDGWLEANLPMTPEPIARRSRRKRRDYTQYLKHHRLSQSRREWLRQTVKSLRREGRVVVVRLPIPDWMLTLEDELDPEFNQQMSVLAESSGASYLNYSGRHDLTFTDGNHLHKDSGFTELLAADLKVLAESP